MEIMASSPAPVCLGVSAAAARRILARDAHCVRNGCAAAVSAAFVRFMPFERVTGNATGQSGGFLAASRKSPREGGSGRPAVGV